MVAVVIGYVILVIHELRNPETTPKLEFRSGAWVPLWLAGLSAISWLGSYPDLDKHAGNLGWLGFGWAILVVAVFSALIMWLATSMRLPVAEVEEHLHGEDRGPWEGDETKLPPAT